MNTEVNESWEEKKNGKRKSISLSSSGLACGKANINNIRKKLLPDISFQSLVWPWRRHQAGRVLLNKLRQQLPPVLRHRPSRRTNCQLRRPARHLPTPQEKDQHVGKRRRDTYLTARLFGRARGNFGTDFSFVLLLFVVPEDKKEELKLSHFADKWLRQTRPEQNKSASSDGSGG